MQKGFVLMSVVGLALFAGTAVAGQEVSNDLSRCTARGRSSCVGQCQRH